MSKEPCYRLGYRHRKLYLGGLSLYEVRTAINTEHVCTNCTVKLTRNASVETLTCTGSAGTAVCGVCMATAIADLPQ